MSLPATMTVVECHGAGGPEVLAMGERPVPVPGSGEILIEVAAAGVNRPDILQRSGQYPPPPGASDLLGLEVAGTVVALGADTTRYRVGDGVCALAPGGGYAAFCKVPQPHALPIPAGLTPIEAAAIPETFFTVWTNVFERGALRPGETLLVHGGTSGIGTTAIMLAKRFGARVIATAGTAAKCRSCLDLGADVAINYREEDFVAASRNATANNGADVILDMVGGSYVERNYEAAAEGGRIVQIAFLEGARTTVNFTKLMTKRLIHTGSTLRPRSIAEKAAIAMALEAKVWPLFSDGSLRPVIDRVFPFAQAAEAHRTLEGGTPIGKIVLDVGMHR